MKITDNFDSDEFDCHDGTDVPADLMPNLIELCTGVLQPVRTKYGHPRHPLYVPYSQPVVEWRTP